MVLYNYKGQVVFDADEFDYKKYIYGDSGLLHDAMTGLKVLYLDGDTTGMSGDVKKDMQWSFNGETGSCTVKWQGSSSVALVKKNYSLKLDAASDWGSAWERTKWGSQKKYVLKANYTDFTHAAYWCAARLWGEVVQARHGTLPQAMLDSLNYGTVDGFPVMLVMNGKYVGLYTVMTHKEIATNVDSVGGYFLTAQNQDLTFSTAVSFSAHTSDYNLKNEVDYECVNAPNEDDLTEVADSLNACVDAVLQAGSGWQTDVADYLDVEAAIDYYIFRCLLGDSDGYCKNQGMLSYDKAKWYHTVYDLDHAFATAGTRSWHISPEEDLYLKYATYNKVFNLIRTYSKTDLKNRYFALREGVLREAHVYDLLANFINDIPGELYAQEDRLWPLTPNSSTASLHQMADWYRLRCEWSDAYINAL